MYVCICVCVRVHDAFRARRAVPECYTCRNACIISSAGRTQYVTICTKKKDVLFFSDKKLRTLSNKWS